MATIVVILGALIAALGAVGVGSPGVLMRLATSFWRSERSIYTAAAIRLILGVALIVAAPDCRFPAAVRILGAISIAGAIIVPVLGFNRLRSLIDWWASRPHALIRAWCLLVMAFGGFLVYAGL